MSNRIWIYQSTRSLNEDEVSVGEKAAKTFAASWISHHNNLSATAQILHNRFLILSVDEAVFAASGCSIDKSLRFVQDLEQYLGASFLNRMFFSFRNENNKIQTVDRDTFIELYSNNMINKDTIVFDTLLSNDVDFNVHFEKKLSESWHFRMV